MKTLKKIFTLFLITIPFLSIAFTERKSVLNITEEDEYGVRYDSVLDTKDWMFNVPKEKLNVTYTTPYCEYEITLMPNSAPRNYTLNNQMVLYHGSNGPEVTCNSNIVYQDQQRNFNINSRPRNEYVYPIAITQLDWIFFIITPVVFLLGVVIFGVWYFYDKKGALKNQN